MPIIQISEKEKKEIEKVKKEKREAIEKILTEILTEEEKKTYIKLSEATGFVYGLMFMLEDQKILEKLGEDTASKVKNSIGLVVSMAGEKIENDMGKEKADLIKKELIENNLV